MNITTCDICDATLTVDAWTAGEGMCPSCYRESLELTNASDPCCSLTWADCV